MYNQKALPIGSTSMKGALKGLPIYKTFKVKKSAVILWVSAICTGFFIFFLSSQTGGETAGLSSGIAEFITKLLYREPDLKQIENVHYLIRQTVRIMLFAGFGFFTAEAVYVTFSRFKLLHLFPIVSLLCSALAFTDEWRKQYITGRHFQIDEAVLNIISVCTGTLLAILVLHFCRKVYKKQQIDKR